MKDAGVSTREERLKEHLRAWFEAAMTSLEKGVDEKTRVTLLESCGRACAYHGSFVEHARTIREGRRKIDELLDQLSGQTQGQVVWQRNGDSIQVVYKRCFCPLRGAGLVQSPSFCKRSAGWPREVFETASGRPAKVEIPETIGRGDSICKFALLNWEGLAQL